MYKPAGYEPPTEIKALKGHLKYGTKKILEVYHK